METGPARVMTLGQLSGPFGTESAFARRGLGAGAQIEPQWTTNFLNPRPTSPQVPQNLLRATLQNGPRVIDPANNVGRVLSLMGLGQANANNGASTTQLAPPAGTATTAYGAAIPPVMAFAWAAAVAASTGASAYHGYKRNDVPGKIPLVWALVWATMGAAFPLVTPAIGAAQGWGKRKRR